MKIFLSILITFFLITATAYAKMVRYVDKDGVIRYVNTDYAQVPIEYRWQVEPPPEEEPEQEAVPSETEMEIISTENKITEPAQKPLFVELFVRQDCDACRLLELKLNGGKIPYAAYDVDIHPNGQEVYAREGGELPFVRIDGKIIRDKIMYWIQRHQWKSPVGSPTQNP